jgi:general secretion pathway protein G
MNITAKFKKGFTLIELLVVVSIIGLLATLVTANLNAARSRARDTVRKADLKNLQTALRLYYNDKVSYPIQSAIVWGGEFAASGVTYMNKVPADPVTDQAYYYAPDSANDTFALYGCLENLSDSNCTSTIPSGWTCTSNCVYKLMP